MQKPLTRREWLGLTLLAASLAPIRAVAGAQAVSPRLAVKLRAPTKRLEPGRHALGLRRQRDGLIYVPSTVQRGTPTPILLMLHGAGGSAQGIESRFPMAEEAGIVLVAPSSAGGTWDGIRGRYGEDVRHIASVLDYTIDHVDADARRFGVAGFSDGASYALALGLANGDLFSHVIAFSPGFIPPADEKGRPGIFISHGTHDTVLPIESTSRRIVPRLRAAGYTLDYREFDGPHTVPAGTARAAFDWFTGRRETGS